MPYYLAAYASRSGERAILLRFRYHNLNLKMPTGLRIKPEDWDKRRQRPRMGFRYYQQYVAVLDKMEDLMRSAYYNSYLTRIPAPDELRAAVEAGMRPVEPETVLAYARRFVSSRTESHSVTSVRLYRRTVDLLEQFDPASTFAHIDMDWLDRFKAFLMAKGFEQNTVAKHFATLRTIINDATDRGANTSMKYKTRAVSVGRVTTTKVFLDEDELMRLYKAKMPNEQKELARDTFIVASYTGVRYQDIAKIGRDSFVQLGGRPHFRFTAQKTGDEQLIPAHPYVIEIMTKHKWRLPALSIQKYNQHLKEICKLAGIDQDVIVTSYPGGKRVDKRVPKCDMVSSHTARRNLVCNMLLAGVAPETIKKISGHKSQDAFEAYVRLTPSDHLKIAFKSDFFRQKTK